MTGPRYAIRAKLNPKASARTPSTPATWPEPQLAIDLTAMDCRLQQLGRYSPQEDFRNRVQNLCAGQAVRARNSDRRSVPTVARWAALFCPSCFP